MFVYFVKPFNLIYVSFTCKNRKSLTWPKSREATKSCFGSLIGFFTYFYVSFIQNVVVTRFSSSFFSGIHAWDVTKRRRKNGEKWKRKKQKQTNYKNKFISTLRVFISSQTRTCMKSLSLLSFSASHLSEFICLGKICDRYYESMKYHIGHNISKRKKKQLLRNEIQMSLCFFSGLFGFFLVLITCGLMVNLCRVFCWSNSISLETAEA